MPKNEIVGTGITAREVVRYDVTGNTPGDIEALREHLDVMFGEHNNLFATGGMFCVKTETARLVCEEIMKGKNTQCGFEKDSSEDFAQRILKWLKVSKHCIDNGDANRAAAWGFVAGTEWATATMKWSFEKEILKARANVERNRVNGAKGGQAEKRAERHKVLDELALGSMQKFTLVSDVQRLRNAKGLARQHDQNADPRLFHDARGRLLSDKWFKGWLADFLAAANFS